MPNQIKTAVVKKKKHLRVTRVIKQAKNSETYCVIKDDRIKKFKEKERKTNQGKQQERQIF